MNKALVTAIAVVFIAQMCFATLIVNGSEAEGAIARVEPSYQTVSSGETFSVDIYVDPKGNTTVAADFILRFNNTLLNATSITNGTFFSGFATMEYGKGINNTAGRVDYGEAIWPIGDVGVTIPGTLATITFQVIAERGISELDFEKVTLSDPLGIKISNVTVINGTVEIGANVFFDTGMSENPYPSISGTHNGTIKSGRTIAVNRIYTYSCAGTGGHTEYARIWGNGVDAHATWSGYAGDWHNLSFDSTFTLEPGVEYNYTIRTGSYPQIIHAQSGEEYNATGGKIKCTEFVDANGKRYTNRIPAFRLWKGGE